MDVVRYACRECHRLLSRFIMINNVKCCPYCEKPYTNIDNSVIVKKKKKSCQHCGAVILYARNEKICPHCFKPWEKKDKIQTVNIRHYTPLEPELKSEILDKSKWRTITIK